MFLLFKFLFLVALVVLYLFLYISMISMGIDIAKKNGENVLVWFSILSIMGIFNLCLEFLALVLLYILTLYKKNN